MKKLSIVLALAMVFMAGQVMAQPTFCVDTDADPTTCETSVTLDPTIQTSFDVYLVGQTASQNGGGFYLDWSDQTAGAAYVSVVPAEEANGGPWQDGAGNILNEVNGVGTIAVLLGSLGGAAPDGNGNLKLGTVTMECTAPGVDVTIDITDVPGVSEWAPLDETTIVDPVVYTMDQEGCSVDADCTVNNDLWCDGRATCVAGACIVEGADPCAAGDPADDPACSDDICAEAGTPGDTEEGTCTYECNAVTSTDPCCADSICAGNVICEADVTIIKESGYYQPPGAPDEVVTIKNRICLDNPSDLVGGIQFDICDSPDCIECIDCELTERTVMFDCVVLELPNGCCRVIMFCKNPGCAINPGLCNIVTVVMQTKEGAPPECGEDCIDEAIGNIVVSDYDGFEIAGAGIGGTLCPVVCGDVCPPGTGSGNDCGDGVVDIYDIMCEVDFALTLTTPNACQAPRADVPTGTPPDCTAPDGEINILDIMVLIDMALNRQDCCSFYYQGIIY